MRPNTNYVHFKTLEELVLKTENFQLVDKTVPDYMKNDPAWQETQQCRCL